MDLNKIVNKEQVKKIMQNEDEFAELIFELIKELNEFKKKHNI